MIKERKTNVSPATVDSDDDIAQLSKAVLELSMNRGKLSATAAAAVLGVDRSYISLVRSGKRNLRLAHLAQLADAAHIPLQMLLAEAMPVDVARVPPHLREKLKRYESLLADGAEFLRNCEAARAGTAG